MVDVRFNRRPSWSYTRAVDALAEVRQAEGIDSAVRAAATVVADQGAAYMQSRRLRKKEGWNEQDVFRLMGLRPRSFHAGDQEWNDMMVLAEPAGIMDHGEFYYRDRQPYSMVGHPYQLGSQKIGELYRVCSKYMLGVHLTGASWYFSGATLMVEVRRLVEVDNDCV